MADSPRFVHLDDLKWQEVRRQRHGEPCRRPCARSGSTSRPASSRSTRSGIRA